MNRDDLIRAARGWIGTRWQHHGRTRAGVDCVGLLIALARDCRLVDEERLDRIEKSTAGYSRYPSGDTLKRALDEVLCRTSVGEARAGDVALIRMRGELCHVGLLADHPDGGMSLIHSVAMSPRRVVEQRMLSGRIVAAYSMPGVD